VIIGLVDFFSSSLALSVVLLAKLKPQVGKITYNRVKKCPSNYM